MNRSVLISGCMLALSVMIAAPSIVVGGNGNTNNGNGNGGSLKKTAVLNPNAPDFTSIFNWGLKLKNMDELFLIAGHGAHDADGNILFPGDAVGQTQYILDNFDEFLEDNGYQRKNIIRIEFTMTTEVGEAEFGAILGLFADYFAPVSIKPAAGTLRVVDGLAIPGMMVEYEIWAAK
jgi:enamine deaminase RidA (YjgF/YER057c/UK114 family)